MRYRHYAPKADLILVEGDSRQVVDKINTLVQQAEDEGKQAGILATEETKDLYPKGQVISIGKRIDEAEIARHLYEVLRRFDTMEVDVIYSESFSTSGVGQAIMNRLLKAAGHKKIFADA
jgi:L-threonylcarbamoyladenylate synthase